MTIESINRYYCCNDTVNKSVPLLDVDFSSCDASDSSLFYVILARGGQAYNAQLRTSTEESCRPEFFNGHTGSVVACCISRDANFALTGSTDGTVKHWVVVTGHAAFTYEHDGPVSAVRFSPDDKKFISASEKTEGSSTKYELTIFDLSRKAAPLKTVTGHKGKINKMVWSAQGNVIITASDDKTVRIWDAKTLEQKEMVICETPILDITLMCIALKDGSKKDYITWGSNRTAYILILESGRKPIHGTFACDTILSSVSAHPNGAEFVCASKEDYQLYIHDIAGNKKASEPFGSHSDTILAIRCHELEDMFTTISADGTRGVWKINRQQE